MGCKNNICDKDTSACTIGCIDGYYQTTDDICSQCPSRCLKCSSTDSCSDCTNVNYWGAECQNTCEHCSSCGQYGCSSSCDSRFYREYSQAKAGYECLQCPGTCASCTSRNDCPSCLTNYWGAVCQHTCDHCSSCSKSNGCFSGCFNGYYRKYNYSIGGYECVQCPGTCESCNAENNCQSCKTGYWGTVCQHTCNNCASCSKTGGCSSCNTGYYRVYSYSLRGGICNECRETCTSCTDFSTCQSCSRKYWGTTCSNPCPNSCELCTSNTACSACVAGYWGSFCQYSCSGCNGSTCSKTQGCTNGCIIGYYLEKSGNEFHCKECHDACTKCADSVSCTHCPSGFVGSQCQHDCRACNGQVCDAGTGDCTHACSSNEYFKMDGVNIGCFKCPEGCSNCYSAYQCKTCVTGKWGYACSNNCSSNCYNDACFKTDGHCSSGCVDRYFGNNCSSMCLSTCKSCSNGYNCETCVTGSFNGNNYNKCECSTNKCSEIKENVCKQCSDNTVYPALFGCCPCSANCKYNTCSTDGLCIDCIDGKYGANCDLNCSTMCKDSLCYRNGSCISCKENWLHGPKCSLNCSDSISNCNMCYGQSGGSLTCIRCYSGWYADGAKCTACSGHCKASDNPKCDLSTGACNTECDIGWFGERCDMACNVKNCQTCSNEDPNMCMYCEDGFYQQTSASCIACPLHCLAGSMCNKHNGSCLEGCDANWSGVTCEIPCPSGCRQCDKLNHSSCSLCKEEFYGDSCEKKCKSGCVTKNQSHTCHKSNGTCNFDCKDELWGDQCDKQCGKGCSGNACNSTTGFCLSKCYDTHFGQMCDSQCSENFVPSTERSCYEIDGFCRKGCQNGWFGRQCNDHCGENCKGNICDRNNGFCIAGCIDGFKGSICAQALRSNISSGSNATTIGGGIGAAVAVLVIAALIVVIVIQRRRLTRATDSREHTANVVATDSQATDETNLKPTPDYQNLAIGTTYSTDRHAHDSIECTSTYQELNKETRHGTEYSTLDEITPT